MYSYLIFVGHTSFVAIHLILMKMEVHLVLDLVLDIRDYLAHYRNYLVHYRDYLAHYLEILLLRNLKIQRQKMQEKAE
uniref:Uncharacterized protein n=1 Tax=Acrobeloides nanus TaxID=290746 RepID=A0A914DZS8_9BILA